MKAKSKQTLLIAAIVSIGGFLFGFDASVISGVIRFVKPEFRLTDLQLGWVVSSPSFSAMFAMLVAGSVSDAIGRKRVLLIVAFLYAVSAVLSAVAVNYPMLVIARMIGGAAFGAALILAPMYIAEISPAEERGRLVSVQQLNIVLGFSVAYFSNYLILRQIGVSGLITEETGWRWMLGIEAVPAVAYLFLLLLVPRSPRWLFLKHRDEEARRVLTRLHGEQTAQSESILIRKHIEADRELTTVPVRELFGKSMRFVMGIGLLVGFLQQITGINAVFFYATSIFEQSGVGTDASFSQAVLVGIINVVFTVLAMVLIDRIGRRPLLLMGIAGIAVSMLITAYGFGGATYRLTADQVMTIEGIDANSLEPILDREFDDDLAFKNALKEALGEQEYSRYEGAILQEAASINAVLVLVGILAFVASFAFSLGPVMWVLLSEMFPNRLRGLAISVIGFTNSFVSWFVQFIFPWELSTFGNSTTFLIYAGFAILGLVLFARWLPETKGKALEQIEDELVWSRGRERAS